MQNHSTALPGSGLPGIPPIFVVEDPEAVAAMLKPPRPTILEALREPGSAAALSRKLGMPRQRLSYHLVELEKHGLVELVEERRKGNCLEKIVRAKSEHFLIDPGALGELSADRPDRIADRFSWSYLVATAAKALRDLSRLRRGADQQGKKLPTLTLQTRIRFGTPEEVGAFTEELSALLASLATKYHNESHPRGRSFSFFLGGYPTPKTDLEDRES